MGDLPVRVEPTEYRVTDYPEGGTNAHHFTMWVSWRGDDRWCVRDMLYCYDKDGNRAYEPLASSRTDDFKDRFRFSLDEALALAQKLVPKLRLGAGRNRPEKTAEEMWEWEQGVSHNPRRLLKAGDDPAEAFPS